MNLISNILKNEREYNELLNTVKEQMSARVPHPSRLVGLCDGARNAIFATVISELRRCGSHTVLLLVPDEKEAMRAHNTFTALGLNSRTYSYRDFVFYNITASREYEHERLGVLHTILDGSCDVVVTTPDAALQYTMPKSKLESTTFNLSINDTVDLSKVKEMLVTSGYQSVDMVNGVGQFSVRGGILDVFPAGSENPVRIEFFGDDIDSMGLFDIITQRRIEQVDQVKITPSRELIVDSDARQRIASLVKGLIKKAKSEQSKDILAAEIEAINAGGDLRFADKYISLIYENSECLFDYFENDSVILCREYNACIDRVKSYEWHTKQNVTSLLEDGLISGSVANYGGDYETINKAISTHSGIIADSFMSSIADMRFAAIFSMTTKQTVSYAENFELLTEDLRSYLNGGFKTVLLCENEIMAKNLSSMLQGEGINTQIVDEDFEFTDGINAVITYGIVLSGFELSVSKFALLSTYSAGSAYNPVHFKNRKTKSKKKSAREKIMSYADLSEGDYVVHVTHGIGMFLGIQSVTVDGVTRDYIKIKYAGTDIIYLPCEQLDSISKYIGAKGEDGTLKLSRIGGAEWGKTKRQAKAAAKEMAKELIQLYAERQRRPGFAFLPDDDMQRDFEAAFPYEETEGQLNAISEVKRDMETARPMDRLLCGDVGFGKTEVALRSAFKAVESGKQVAILVPTTILALQHYQTLLSRLRGFPVRVDMLSRFRSAKQQQETLRRVRRGEVDIVVGTHRIVSKDVVFKDLGLVIIDEEQRFGVAAKEKLRQLSSGVDTLTLTATPIPRTLNMAMSGIRDMSVLEEAPNDRVPVQTYVLEYDEMILSDAIAKELRRGGQVFYLHNRVDNMADVYAKVSQLAPDARIAVAHGKMDKEELSDIWRSMLDGEIDVLISTTIIEAGVDVPNANTLIIENADRLGLSQLHQIRGRIGRSSRRAYAYFTYQKGRVLTEIAAKRLGAIREYTEFGSGFKVALRDLEIRGAGNILGSEQHGHIENVGYDMYMRILNEAILEEKGETKAQKTECAVEMNVSAYIPESYIKSPVQRIDVYKKISLIENVADKMDIVDELLDRYGDMPRSVSSLLDVSLLRACGSACGINKIIKRGSSVIFYPDKMDIRIWSMLTSDRKGAILMSLELKPYVTLRTKAGDDVFKKAIDLLTDYQKIMNSSETEEKQ
ncbi:MAG: transcription-repair coupling factor [Clostridia bacterium]|nr:transcription-repair coupling factor [Clostridia bacterium]